MSVDFATGRELTEATGSLSFDYFSTYALLWFGQGQVAIVRLDRVFIGVGDVFDAEDFNMEFGILSSTDGRDRGGRVWRIKTQRLGLTWF